MTTPVRKSTRNKELAELRKQQKQLIKDIAKLSQSMMKEMEGKTPPKKGTPKNKDEK